jgi:hypothetical protein
MPAKPKPQQGRFRTLVDNLSHDKHNHRVGSVVDCLPEKSVEWMLACGWIEPTTEEANEAEEVTEHDD